MTDLANWLKPCPHQSGHFETAYFFHQDSCGRDGTLNLSGETLKLMRFLWPDSLALNAHGFGWLSLHTAYFQVKKDCLRTRLSIGESNIYGKTTSPCQLIFWAIGWLIWIKETLKKKVKRISRYPHNKLEAREGIKKHLTYTVTKKSFSQ